MSAETSTRTIILPLDVKPWKACGEAHWPHIHHGWLHRRDDGLWLVTTDSFIACAIRVEGDAEEGWVNHGAMRWLAKGRAGVQVGETRWQFERDGFRVFDVGDLEPFPMDALGGLWDTDDGAKCSVIGLDPRRLSTLAKALGAGDRLQVELTGPRAAIRVTVPGRLGHIGVLMPVVLDGTESQSS